MQKYSIVIAGSTAHTRICAESLLSDGRFAVSAVITPPPQLVGRKQQLVTNPLQQFAVDNQIPVVPVEKRLDAEVRHNLETVLQTSEKAERPDFLLVVDFGYLVPNWLLELPKVAPINVHPSTLPRWRGSSPGQFALLYAEKESAVSVIVMNEGLDTGDLIAQLPFSVDPAWTQTEYYNYAFEMVAKQLAQILDQLASGQIQREPQAVESPTPVAGRFTKEDGFVPWEAVQACLDGDDQSTNSDSNQDVFENSPLSPILSAALQFHGSWSKLIYHATKAFSPWPGVWTMIPTAKGEKRMKILSTEIIAGSPTKLQLQQVQIEGKEAASWNQVKNVVQE